MNKSSGWNKEDPRSVGGVSRECGLRNVLSDYGLCLEVDRACTAWLIKRGIYWDEWKIDIRKNHE